MNLLIAFIIFAATPEPVTRFSDKVEYATGTAYRCYSMDVPIYYHEDNTGKLLPVNLDADDQTHEIDGKLFDRRVGLPMQSGVLQEAKETRIVTIHSDLDWQYPDRRMEWTIDSVMFDGKDKKPKLKHAEKVSAAVRKASDDFAVYNDAVRVRTAQKIKVKSATDFCITHRLKLVDLVIKNATDGNDFYIVENGEFVIETPSGEERFRIGKPKILSSTFSIVSEHTLHTLRWLGDDEYEYMKYPSPELTLEEWQAGEWIDADTYNSTTADGWTLDYNAVWSTARNGTGWGANTSVTSSDFSCYHQGGNYYITRFFYYFDTSGIGAEKTVTGCDLYLYTNYIDNTLDLCVQKGTQGSSLSASDYDNFSGNYYSAISAPASTGWFSFTFNETGKSEIEKTATTKICLRSYSYDYQNSAPPSETLKKIPLSFAESSYKPYLSITATAPSTRKPTTVLHYNRMRTNR